MSVHVAQKLVSSESAEKSLPMKVSEVSQSVDAEESKTVDMSTTSRPLMTSTSVEKVPSIHPSEPTAAAVGVESAACTSVAPEKALSKQMSGEIHSFIQSDDAACELEARETSPLTGIAKSVSEEEDPSLVDMNRSKLENFVVQRQPIVTTQSSLSAGSLEPQMPPSNAAVTHIPTANAALITTAPTSMSASTQQMAIITLAFGVAVALFFVMMRRLSIMIHGV